MNSILAAGLGLAWIVIIMNLGLTFVVIRRINGSDASDGLDGTAEGESRPKSKRLEPLPIGANIPDFVAQTISGESVSLKDYIGRKNLFIFIAPYCGPCEELMPLMEQKFEDIKKASYDLTYISTANLSMTQGFIKDYNITVPVLYISDMVEQEKLLDDFNISGTPAYFAFDAKGIVLRTGAANGGRWEKFLQNLLAKKI